MRSKAGAGDGGEHTVSDDWSGKGEGGVEVVHGSSTQWWSLEIFWDLGSQAPIRSARHQNNHVMSASSIETVVLL